MTLEKLGELADKVFAECKRVLVAKGTDYSRVEDTLTSFKEIARDIGTTPEMVLWIFTKKHLRAVDSYVRNGQLESEPFESRIGDSINYLLLMDALVQDKLDKEDEDER